MGAELLERDKVGGFERRTEALEVTGSASRLNHPESITNPVVAPGTAASEANVSRSGADEVGVNGSRGVPPWSGAADADVVSTDAPITPPNRETIRRGPQSAPLLNHRELGATEVAGDDEDSKPLWKYLLNTLLTVLMILVLALTALKVVVPRVVGAVPLRVLSGSMEPRFSAGDLIVTRPVDANAIRVGDIVTFQPVSGDPTLITHRVISVVIDGQGNNVRFTTQGDANNVADEPIIPDQVMGRVMYSIPFLGHITGGEGSFAMTAVIGIGLLGYAVVMLLKPDKPKDAPKAAAQVDAIAPQPKNKYLGDSRKP